MLFSAMPVFKVTEQSKEKRAAVLGNTLDEIISESIKELFLPAGEYKV